VTNNQIINGRFLVTWFVSLEKEILLYEMLQVNISIGFTQNALFLCLIRLLRFLIKLEKGIVK
jgi:hypothetical protein